MDNSPKNKKIEDTVGIINSVDINYFKIDQAHTEYLITSWLSISSPYSYFTVLVLRVLLTYFRTLHSTNPQSSPALAGVDHHLEQLMVTQVEIIGTIVSLIQTNLPIHGGR